MTSNAKAAAGCLSTLLALPVAVMLNGYVLSVLWGWFMVPVFHLPAIGVASGCGIAVVMQMLTNHTDCQTDKDREWWVPVAMLFIQPALGLLSGFIYHSFM